jgi:Cdc6-like AAA superfamily ATPase
MPEETKISDEHFGQCRFALSNHFRPGTAINTKTLFSGRFGELRSVTAAAMQPGQHAIIFGERGVGKTSIGKVVSEVMRAYGYLTLQTGTINCDGRDTFASIWHKAFREIAMAAAAKADVGFTAASAQRTFTLDSMLNENVSPDDVRFALSRLNSNVLIALDEVDKVKDVKETTALLADTIKTLADHAPNVTLILIGISDTVEDLIAEHKSVERSLVQVQMPRMKSSELTEILTRGYSASGMGIDDDAAEWICSISQGLPHFTHILGLYAGQRALERRSLMVSSGDVNNAIAMAVENSFSLLSAYDKAVVSPQKKNRYASVLLACALSARDELGWFPAGAVAEPLSRIEKRQAKVPDFARHLQEFCDPKRGPILEHKGEARARRYRFVDPMMDPFTQLHGYRDGRLPFKNEVDPMDA